MTEEKSGCGPFVRNRYFPGKMLSAGDFTEDQEYYNAKMAWTRKSFFGSGVIQGLAVAKRDEDRVSLAGGSAVDCAGRLIVVPENRDIALSGLWDAGPVGNTGGSGRLILGIRYAERDLDRAPSPLEQEGPYYARRTEETWELEIHTEQEWLDRQAGRKKALEAFFERQVLYEDARLRLVQVTPRIVEKRRSFVIRFMLEPLAGMVSCRFSAACRLENGRLAGGGEYYRAAGEACTDRACVLAEAEALAGSGERELLLYTSDVDLTVDGARHENVGSCQALFLTAVDCGEAVRGRLRDSGGTGGGKEPAGETPGGEDWIPLAGIRFAPGAELCEISCVEDLRCYAEVPRLETAVREILRESGIGCGKWTREPVGPIPPPFPPRPVPPAPLPVPREVWREWLREDWERRIRHGVAVIPVPRHYRRGRVLISGEISHGFPGERVLIWFGRMWKEEQYAYWEKDRISHNIVQGPETLFPAEEDKGWLIEKQSLKLHLEKGTFEVAVSLKKKWWKKREKEIAVSWTAVRLT